MCKQEVGMLMKSTRIEILQGEDEGLYLITIIFPLTGQMKMKKEALLLMRAYDPQ